MKILSIVGARPQFIKAAPLSHIIRQNHTEYLVHTGQHYDQEMSQLFFDDLSLPRPDANLGIGSESHAVQTANMMIGLEKEILNQEPDVVLVYGDTNSTLAGALAAAKLNVPVSHVEAGLRSFNRDMPEEINRVLTDRISDHLFCPTAAAMQNLEREGLAQRSHLVGDVMVDALQRFSRIAETRVTPLQRLDLEPGGYCLATVHRAANTDNPGNLKSIVSALATCGEKVVFPVHPRCRKALADSGLLENLTTAANVTVTKPLGYLDMLLLEKHAAKILTDSGGIQKEAYIWKVPCITLRDETEWVETVELGWNCLVGADAGKIIEAIRDFSPNSHHEPLYGNGDASKKIVAILEQ